MNEKLEKVKTHIREHKHAYGYALCGAAMIAIGAVAIRKQPSNCIINTVAPIFNNAVASSLGGHLRKIVYCVDLDRYFESVTAAAAFADIPVPVMSKHLNGHKDHINGMIFKIVGVGN